MMFKRLQLTLVYTTKWKIFHYIRHAV